MKVDGQIVELKRLDLIRHPKLIIEVDAKLVVECS